MVTPGAISRLNERTGSFGSLCEAICEPFSGCLPLLDAAAVDECNDRVWIIESLGTAVVLHLACLDVLGEDRLPIFRESELSTLQSKVRRWSRRLLLVARSVVEIVEHVVVIHWDGPHALLPAQQPYDHVQADQA